MRLAVRQLDGRERRPTRLLPGGYARWPPLLRRVRDWGPGAVVTLEGTPLRALTDSAGVFLLRNVPPGPYVLLARRIGLAPSRTTVAVTPRETVRRDLLLAETALRLPDIVVTAAPGARGELGTARVTDRDAIANETATSLMGILELVPPRIRERRRRSRAPRNTTLAITNRWRDADRLPNARRSKT